MLKHKNSKLQVYSNCRFVDGDDPTKTVQELNAIAKCRNGPSVIANVALYDDERQKSKGGFKSYFLIHKDEYEVLKKSKSYTMDQKLDFIENLDFFVQCRKKRKFFIREVGGQFFLDEILNLLPYFVTVSKETLDYIKESIKPPEPHATDLVSTINMEAVNLILEESDIDKNRITVIPDIVHSLKSTSLEKSWVEPAVCIAPNGAYVMHSSMAMLHVFYSLILNRDWTEEACNKDPDSMKRYKKETMMLLKKYAEMNQTFFVPVDLLNQEILSVLVLRFSRVELHPDPQTTHLFYCNKEDCDEDCIEDYKRVVEVFGLPALRMKPSLQTYAARMRLIAAWMTIFDPEHKKITRALLEAYVESISMEDKFNAYYLMDKLCNDGHGHPAIANVPKIISKYLDQIKENLEENARIPYDIHQLKRLPEEVRNVISPDGLRELWSVEQTKVAEEWKIEEIKRLAKEAKEQSGDTEDSETEEIEEPCTEDSETEKIEEPCTEDLETEKIEEPCTEDSETEKIEEPCTEDLETEKIEEPCTEDLETEKIEEPCTEDSETEKIEEPCTEDSEIEKIKELCMEKQKRLAGVLMIGEIEQPYMDAVFQNVSDYFHLKPDILSAFAKSLAEIVQQNQDLMKLTAENGSYEEIAELVCSLCSCPMVMFRVLLHNVSENIVTAMKSEASLASSLMNRLCEAVNCNDLVTLNGLRDLWAREKAHEFPVIPKFQHLGDKLMDVVFESYVKHFSDKPETQIEFERNIFSTAYGDARVKLMLRDKKKKVATHKESKLPMEVHRFCLDHIAKYDLIHPMVFKEFQQAINANPDETTTSKDAGTPNDADLTDKSVPLQIENDKPSSITTDETPEAPKRSRSPKKKQSQPKHPEQRKPRSPPKFITGRLLKALKKTRENKKRHRTPDPPYRPNRETKKEPEPEVQEESQACDKCYRMSQRCAFYKKYLVKTKIQLENCRIKANKYDDLEKKMGEQTKMMGEKMEEKDRKIAELEKLLNTQNDSQSTRIAELEAQLAASQKKVLELEDSSRNASKPEISDFDAKKPSCSSAIVNRNSSKFDEILQQNQKFKEMESRMKRMEQEFEKLKTSSSRTSSPPAPDFNALQERVVEKTAMLNVSEKENTILVSKNVSLKEEVERLNREIEVMRERENAKDAELKKSQRDNQVLQMTLQKHEESFKEMYGATYKSKNHSSGASTSSAYSE